MCLTRSSASGRRSLKRFPYGTHPREIPTSRAWRSDGEYPELVCNEDVLKSSFHGSQIILSAVWSNASLARLAEGYGLQHDLRAAPAQRAALRGNQGVRASLFEARLYGIHLSSGDTSYETIKTFIASLFIPILAAQRAAFQNVSQPSASNAQSFEDYVSRLNTICQRRGAGRIE